jgi:hypothetical protein
MMTLTCPPLLSLILTGLWARPRRSIARGTGESAGYQYTNNPSARSRTLAGKFKASNPTTSFGTSLTSAYCAVCGCAPTERRGLLSAGRRVGHCRLGVGVGFGFGVGVPDRPGAGPAGRNTGQAAQVPGTLRC